MFNAINVVLAAKVSHQNVGSFGREGIGIYPRAVIGCVAEFWQVGLFAGICRLGHVGLVREQAPFAACGLHWWDATESHFSASAPWCLRPHGILTAAHPSAPPSLTMLTGMLQRWIFTVCSHAMPAGHPPIRAHPAKPFRTLRDAARHGQLVLLRCNLCKRGATFLATDLVQVFDPDLPVHIPPLPCSQCKKIEYVDIRIESLCHKDRGRLIIRRLVGTFQNTTLKQLSEFVVPYISLIQKISIIGRTHQDALD